MRPSYYPFLEERAILGVIDVATSPVLQIHQKKIVDKMWVIYLFIILLDSDVFLFTTPSTKGAASKTHVES